MPAVNGTRSQARLIQASRGNMLCLCLFLLPVLFLLALLTSKPALAGDEALYKEAVADYSAKNYDKALTEFEIYLKGDSEKADAFYYLALIHQHLGHLVAAQRAYSFTVKNFPGSNAAAMAHKGLAQVEAALAPGPAVLPRETWIPFARRGTSMIVEAKVNNKRIPMVFDTGAERCAFSLAQFRQLGIPLPSGPPFGNSMGVGKSEPTPIWTSKIDLVVGHIERHDFTVVVGDMALPAPLLGQDFFTGMEYSIDSSNNAISFKKAEGVAGPVPDPVAAASSINRLTVDATGKYVYAVPFTLSGQCAVVKVMINGHELPMVFDTGAEGCLLTASQAKEAGVVTGGRPLPVRGIGGSAMAYLGIVDSIKLGPIEKHQVRMPVTDKIGTKESLLGQDFLRGWHYTIDKSKQVIRFTQATARDNY